MRGQITLEAILAFGAAILILASLTNLNFERLRLSRDVGDAGEARMIGELLASTINNAYANGEGFSIQLDSGILDYATLENVSGSGVGLILPIEIDSTARTINISKNASRTGITTWNVAVPIIPLNISRMDSTTQFPETTIKNNGTYLVIYANRANIAIYNNGSRVD